MHEKFQNRGIYLLLIYRFLLVLFLYSLLRLGFYFFNANFFPAVTLPKFLYMMLGGLKFDVSALLYINALFILSQIIPFPFRYAPAYQRWSKWLFIVTNSIGIGANIADFAYYEFTLKRTTASVFAQFSQEENLAKLWLKFLIDYWYLLLLFLLFVYALIALYERIKLKPRPVFNARTYLLHAGVMLVFALLTLAGMRGGWRHSTRPITLSNAGEFVERPEEMSIVLNTPFSILRTIGSSALSPKSYFSPEELEKIYNPVHRPQPEAPFRDLNVVFLIIESLGKEHVGALNRDLDQGNYKGYTPFIDSLIENGYSFSYSYANGRKSIDALPSIISSIPSIGQPFVLSLYAGNQTSSIAKALSRKGYETAFFHGAPNGSMGFSSFTNLAGIKHYFGKNEYNNNADFDGMWGIWDEPFMQYMARQINELPQPFFVSFFSLSSHHPFKVPAKYEGKFPKGPLPVQEPMGYTDMSLRKFFETAKTMPWFDNTLFVLLADHATVSHYPEYKTIPGGYSIPIVFYYPAGKLNGHGEKLIQQLDVMPTVLGYLNYDQPYFSFGFDAFDSSAENFVVNNNGEGYNFYMGDYFLIFDQEKSIALYNLKTDRLAQHNLLEREPEVRKRMERKLKGFIQQYNNRMIADELTAQ